MALLIVIIGNVGNAYTDCWFGGHEKVDASAFGTDAARQPDQDTQRPWRLYCTGNMS